MSNAPNVFILKETKLYNDAVTLTGYGKYNLFVLLAAGGCLMCVIVETMSMSFIIPAAQCDLDISLGEKGILASAAFLGVIVTSHFWGFIADTRGRRNILIFCLISSSLTSFMCSLVPFTWLLILLRFLNGALIGGSSSVIYAFAGEFHSDRYRAMTLSWISSFVAAGQMYIPGLAWVILTSKWSYYIEGLNIQFKPWRLLIIAYALPSLVVASILALLPESPKYLLSRGKHERTLKILTKMFVSNTGKKSHEFPVSTIILDEILIREEEEEKPKLLLQMWQQTVPLFKKEFIFKTLILCYLQFGVFLSASALSLWYPEILNRMSAFSLISDEVTLCGSVVNDTVPISSFERNLFETYYLKSNETNEAMKCDDTVDTSVFPVVLATGCAIGVTYIVIGILIDRVGKKLLLITAASLTAISGLIAQYITGYTVIEILTGIYLLMASCVGVVNAFVVDLYPTKIRAMALAISLMFGRLGAMVGSTVVGNIYYYYCDYLFIFFAVNHIIFIIAVILLPTKTDPVLLENPEEDNSARTI